MQKLAGFLGKTSWLLHFFRAWPTAMNKVSIATSKIQILFQEQALKKEFTKDGVHLNTEGLKTYKQALLELIN